MSAPHQILYNQIGYFEPEIMAKAKALLKNSSRTSAAIVTNNDMTLPAIIDETNKSEFHRESKKSTTSANFFDTNGKEQTYSTAADTAANKQNKSCMQNIYAALTEGMGYVDGEIGLASIDINCPILYLSQFSDNLLYTSLMSNLQISTPNEILMPQMLHDNKSSSLISTIHKNFSGIQIIPLRRCNFNADEGLAKIRTLCSEDSKTTISSYEKKYYALTAAGALLKYLAATLKIKFLPNSLKVEYQNQNFRMLIDINTAHRLELLHSLVETKDNKFSLFGLLDQTVTAYGKRYLRRRILEPPYRLTDIESFQECVTELLTNSELFILLGKKLKFFSNIDKILKLTVQPSEFDCYKVVEQMLDKIINLKNQLDFVTELAEILKSTKCFSLQKIHSNLIDPRICAMFDIIQQTIRPEVTFIKGSSQCFQRIHAIRSEVNEFLDMLRDEYNKLTEEVHEIVKGLAEKHNLSFRMTYNNGKGFYIQLQLNKVQLENFIQPNDLRLISRRDNNYYFTNFEIEQINSRLVEVIKEAYAISGQIAQEIIGKIIKYVDGIYFLIESISNLDIMMSFAIVSQNNKFICPTFGEEMRIVEAVHPLLEQSITKPYAIPNNIIATPEYNFFIITGPNMGGKTVYIKMIAILQVMAQIGCYVPATQAKFRPCDRIFTRIEAGEDVKNEKSNFILEIQEIEYIFDNLTTNSLVIMDEICRSTNPTEGVELSWKICKKLCCMRGKSNSNDVNETEFQRSLNSEKAFNETNLEKQLSSLCDEGKSFKCSKLSAPFIFITTHFMKLTKLKDIYFNVVNLHLEAEEIIIEDKLTLKFKHKIKEGITPIVGYGLKFARLLNFPENILERAEEILGELLFQDNANKIEELPKVPVLGICEDLEKSFSSEGDRTFERLQFSNNVSRFLESCDETANNLENVSSATFLNDFHCRLYDLYADLAKVFREDSMTTAERDNYNKNVLETFKKSLPKEILDKLLTTSNLNQSNLTTKNTNIPRKSYNSSDKISQSSESTQNEEVNCNIMEFLEVQMDTSAKVIENILIRPSDDSSTVRLSKSLPVQQMQDEKIENSGEVLNITF